MDVCVCVFRRITVISDGKRADIVEIKFNTHPGSQVQYKPFEDVWIVLTIPAPLPRRGLRPLSPLACVSCVQATSESSANAQVQHQALPYDFRLESRPWSQSMVEAYILLFAFRFNLSVG